MLNEIGSIDHVPDFIARVKAGEGRLMGFGHRVYKSYDPRAKIVKRTADEVFEVTGRNPLLEIAHGARAHRAAGRLLRLAQALSERRLLLRAHLPGDGLPHRHVPGALRDPAHVRLAGAVGRDAARSRHEDRAAAAGLHGADERTTCPSSGGADGCARGRAAEQAAAAPPGRAVRDRTTVTADGPGVASPAGVSLAPRSRWCSPCPRCRGRLGLCARASAPRRRPEAGRVTAQRRTRARARSIRAARSSTCGSSWRSARARRARRASSRRGATSATDEGLGLAVTEQPFEAQTPARPVKMVNLSVVLPGASARAPADRRPLRHEAVSRVPFRRRERRRIERGACCSSSRAC